MKIQTPVTQLLGVDLPLFAAPMFLVSTPELVAAVSEAGGVGCFPSLNYRTLPELKSAIADVKRLTSKPFGVNILLYREHNPEWKEQLDLCLAAGVSLIITSMGTPRTAIREAHAAGAKVFCDVTNLRMAEVVAKSGCDALIAVSQGAGGHAGPTSPFSLIPQLKEKIGLPVLAAGSIGTGRQMAAAFALGADAVYCGTRFLCTPESAASDGYKQMILESDPEEIVYTADVSGVAANWLKRSLEHARELRDTTTPHEALKRWKDIWSAGHGIAQIESVLPARRIVEEMVAEYQTVIASLPQPV